MYKIQTINDLYRRVTNYRNRCIKHAEEYEDRGEVVSARYWWGKERAANDFLDMIETVFTDYQGIENDRT
jgi:hypothetical protein